MKAVILAGGEGTRLRPLTYATPKSLLPICNRPFLEHQLRLAQRHGIEEAMLLTGYLAGAFGPFAETMAAEGISLEISTEEKPLGTCGAIRAVLDRLDETTIVFNGDVLTDLDLSSLVDLHRRRGAAVTIALTPVEDAGPYGLVRLESDGRVLEFLEKPPAEVASRGGPINAGTYVIEPRVLQDVPRGEMWSIERQLFPSLLAAGERVFGFHSTDYWLDIGTPQRYLQAHWDLLAGRSRLWADADGGVAEGVSIEPGATIGESVLVGAGCAVGKGAVVGPQAVLGRGALVGEGAKVVRSVLLDGASVCNGAMVDGCILGPGASVAGSATGEILGAGERRS